VRILFVNQSLLLTGGFRVVCEHARGLIRRGHEVRLLAPPVRPPAAGGGLAAWKHYLYERWSGRLEEGLRAYGLEPAVVRFDPARPERVPGADAVVATAWPTAEWVAAMPGSAGRKYYLVQQYEAWTEDIRGRVDRTWKLPLRKIVIAGWLERLGRERFGEEVWARIPNGVDSGRFRPPAVRSGSGVTVGMFYDAAPWKGAGDGIAALWQLHEAEPGLRFLLFGRHRVRQALPPGARYLRDPRQADLPAVYGAADVFLNSSHSEGFSLVLLEAMACGCALVATAVGETPEMGVPGAEYLMVPPRDAAALAAAALGLVRDPARRRAVAEAGLALARRYTWERATDRLERALEDERP
jgi:glycosyltransferase involved in cell wall biosynthesis